MVINYLTNHVYTPWGVRYDKFKFRNEWYAFLNSKDQEVKKIISWFDRNILQCFREDSIITLDVRIRIVCGMVNKLNPNKISREMKIEFMECIWDTYRQFKNSYIDWHCLCELQLPF